VSMESSVLVCNPLITIIVMRSRSNRDVRPTSTDLARRLGRALNQHVRDEHNYIEVEGLPKNLKAWHRQEHELYDGTHDHNDEEYEELEKNSVLKTANRCGR